MTLECEEPYELKGDQFVTCVEGTTFTSTTVPHCEGKTLLSTHWSLHGVSLIITVSMKE